MIVRNGYQVYSWGNLNMHYTWGSASKSVVCETMLLFALNEGLLASPDVQVRPYVQTLFPGSDLIAKDYPISFYHLANSLSGYALNENPGGAWAYNDYAYKLYKYLILGSLFGAIPNDATSVANLISSRLGVLQFQDGNLARIYNGSPFWNGSIRDTARVAWLWLNKGRWNDVQLLQPILFDQYCKAQVPPNLPRSGSFRANDYLHIGSESTTNPNINTTNPHYGYNWNHNLGTDGRLMAPGSPVDLFFAQGNTSYFIVAVPSRSLVAVFHSGIVIGRENRGAIMDKLCATILQ